MKPKNHTTLSATAAIAAALAFTATPLAAPSTDAPPAPSMQSQPIEPAAPVVTVPTPTVVVPDVGPAPDASAAPTTDTSSASPPAATGASDIVAPVKRTTSTHTTVTRTTTVSHTAPAMTAAPVAAVPAPANDTAAAPVAAPAEAVPAAAAPPPLPAEQPTPTQTNDVIGTLGVVLLGLLALAILAAGLLFFRRRHPAVTEVETAPATTREVEEPVATEPVAEAPITEPAADSALASEPMVPPTMLRRRDPNPVRGALPSAGAAIDLPAKLPESYEERKALFERMVDARPDKANPFTDRRNRMRRARLIMQSIGVTFDHEPRIDFSQYPNNWPELQRQYHKAA
jgi:hypothetical protein